MPAASGLSVLTTAVSPSVDATSFTAAMNLSLLLVVPPTLMASRAITT